MTKLPLDLDFKLDEKGRIALIDTFGIRHENVQPVMLFPLTDSDLWVSIQSEDGHEIVCIEDPKRLSEDSYVVLAEALSRRHFVPIIEVIHDIARVTNGHDWNVTTDHGHTIFDVETDESIQSLGNGRLVIVDSRNTRYLIPNVAELDPESRRKLEHYY